jgi:hypothetical protein
VADGGAGLQIYYGPISGIEENEIASPLARNDFIVYPNPARSFFVVRCPFSVDKVTIYDVTGKLVKEVGDCHATARNDNIMRISLDGIRNGIYFVKVNDELLEEKLVVTR